MEEHLLALDDTLRVSCGFGLAHFKYEQSPRRLQPGQMRFAVPLEELDDDMRAASPDRSFRSAICDEQSQQTWLECIHDPEAPLLVMHLDQGSCEWFGRNWLIREHDIRGELFPDPFHRRHNNCLAATKRSGLCSIRVSSVLALNFSQGPWSEGAYQHKLRDCLQQWLSANTCHHPLFMAVYEWVSLDRHGGDLPAAFGTESHMEDTYLWLHHLDVFGKRHTTVKTGRWHSLPAAIHRRDDRLAARPCFHMQLWLVAS